MSWYNDAQLIRNFAEALANAEVLEDSDDFVAFNRKPQRYNEEYTIWEQAGFPTNEDDDGWEEFVDGITSGDENAQTE